ncbi:DUF882 domain-containing protein [Microvirga antarctica]|uniref:DUF882 domain-containing protein n=1 Tax=Microvirga antarctica TaxID=2819233 RepID=UPI003CCE6C89
MTSANRPRAALPLGLRLSLAALALVTASTGTQDATANGDTRSLTILHTHTRESLTVTYRRDGRYDEQALTQLNWLLRDWRTDEPVKMDPRLFDVVWEVYRDVGSSEPVNIVSAYRSPATNGMLRRRSSGVSEHSQHMLGKAMDIRLTDVDTGRLRAAAMRLQYGGVGYYGSSAFVHLDTGSVRAWPRMSQDQLARLFPDGKTVHLPANGKPLSGYELAKAEIVPRNAALAQQASAGGGSLGGLFAGLFGKSKPAPAPVEPAPVQVASATPEPVAIAVASTPLPPLPPRRPASQPIVMASADGTMLPISAAQPSVQPSGPPRPTTNWSEPKTAVQALFDSRTASLNLTFSAESHSDLTITRFSGPAVKPLPVLRQASL